MKRSLAAALVGFAALALGPSIARADIVVNLSAANDPHSAQGAFATARTSFDAGNGVIRKRSHLQGDNIGSYDDTVTIDADFAGVHSTGFASQKTSLTANGNTLSLTSTALATGTRTLTGNTTTDTASSGAGAESYSLNFTVSTRSVYVLTGSFDTDSGVGSSVQVTLSDGPVITAGPTQPHVSLGRSGIIESGTNGFALFTLIGGVGEAGRSSGHASWNFTLNVGPASPLGDDFHWIKKSGGTFGTAANWTPQHVPQSGATNTDHAIFALPSRYTVDFGAQEASDRLEILQGEVTFTNTNYKVDGLSLKDPSLVVDVGKLTLAGGTLTSNSATIGDKHSAGAEVDVVGAQSHWDCLGRLVVGGAEPPGADGKLTVSGGATLTSAEAIVGGGGFQKGGAKVDGTGTSWTVGNIAVGIASQGEVLVTGGAKVSSEEILIGFDSQVVVAGTDAGGTASEWDGTRLAFALTPGALVVDAGGIVKVTDVIMDTALILVKGVSKFNASPSFFACNSIDAKHGVFEVGDGGQVFVVVGQATFGIGGATGASLLEVVGKDPATGVPSLFQTDGLLSVGAGDGGVGSLEVSGGAKLTCGNDASVGAAGKSVGVALVSGGSTWTVQGNVFVGDQGTGIVVLDSSTLNVTGDVVVAAGSTLQGNGTVITGGSVQANGFVSPGITQLFALVPLSPPKRGIAPRAKQVTPPGGKLTIQGNLVVGATGVIAAEAGGSQSDQLVVTGTATLDGTLVLQFKNGFAPKTGAQFDVLHVNGSVTGAFASVETRGLAPGATFDVTTTGGVFKATATNNAVALPTVSVKTAKKLAEKSKRPGAFTISRSGSTANALTVTYDVGGTATNGIDYILLSGTATIPAHKKSVKVPVKTVDDTDHEGDETLDVTIVPGADYTHSLKSAARLTIVDND